MLHLKDWAKLNICETEYEPFKIKEVARWLTAFKAFVLSTRYRITERSECCAISAVEFEYYYNFESLSVYCQALPLMTLQHPVVIFST
jgi:hypothetical protein